MEFNIDFQVTRIGLLDAKVALEPGMCAFISGDDELDKNVTIGDRTFGLVTESVAIGKKVNLACGSGTIFTTDQHADDMAAGDELVVGADGLLKKVVTAATDFIVAECISNVSSVLKAKLLM